MKRTPKYVVHPKPGVTSTKQPHHATFIFINRLQYAPHGYHALLPNGNVELIFNSSIMVQITNSDVLKSTSENTEINVVQEVKPIHKMQHQRRFQ